jgi:SAM-dependent methyltransferase
LPWGPEDWDALLLRDEERVHHSPLLLEAVEEVLLRIPDRRQKTVADLGCGMGGELPFLSANFGRVIAVDYAPASLAAARRLRVDEPIEFRRRDLRDLKPFRRSLDVAIAVDSILGPRDSDIDRIFEQVHRSLVEGGVFLATFPAVSRDTGPYPMRLGESEDVRAPHHFHEIELQYRLRRAGFQGVRVRRFDPDGDRPESLLCMAVRRANN